MARVKAVARARVDMVRVRSAAVVNVAVARVVATRAEGGSAAESWVMAAEERAAAGSAAAGWVTAAEERAAVGSAVAGWVTAASDWAEVVTVVVPRAGEAMELEAMEVEVRVVAAKG